MNQIGQSLLPIAPAPPDPAAPNLGGKEASGNDESFDSLLDQSSSQTPEPQTPPVDEPAIAAAPEPDPADALVPAGLISVWQSTVICPTPPPVPEPTVESDLTESKPAADHPTAEPIVPAPASNADLPARVECAKTSLPLVPASRRIAFTPLPTQTPASAPAPTDSQPESEPNTEALLDKPQSQESATPIEPALIIANGSGLVLPIPPIPFTSTDSAASNPPAPPVQPAALSIRPIVNERVAAPAPAPTIAPAPLPRAISIAESGKAVFAEAESETQPVFSAPLEISAAPAPKAMLPPTPPAVNAEQAPSPTLVSAPAARNPEAEKNTGMTAAKPSDAMPAPTIQRSPRTSRATSAEPIVAEAAPKVTTIERTPTLHATPVLASQNGRERSPNEHAENKSQPAFPEIAPTGIPQPSMTMTLPATSTSTSREAVTPIRAADVVQVVEHTASATAQFRASGLERMEIAVRLDSGHELTIQLHMANGQVTPVIRTESEPLRLALEQNWSQFSQRSGDREVRLTTPVFESPQTSSNMSDLNQQRDGRQRAYEDAAPDYLYPPSLRRNAPHHPQHSAASSPAPSVGVRHYA